MGAPCYYGEQCTSTLCTWATEYGRYVCAHNGSPPWWAVPGDVVPAEDRVPQIVDRQVTSHFEKEVKKQADFEEAEFENFVQAFEEFENPVWDEYNEQGVG